MSELLRTVWAKLIAPRDDDPLGDIGADQLAIVLRSIEEKYATLRDENARLQEKVEAQQREIVRLTQALAARDMEEPGRV